MKNENNSMFIRISPYLKMHFLITLVAETTEGIKFKG